MSKPTTLYTGSAAVAMVNQWALVFTAAGMTRSDRDDALRQLARWWAPRTRIEGGRR